MIYDWGGPPAAVRSTMARSALMGKGAFDDGRAYGVARRAKFSQDEINAFCTRNAGAKDDYTKGIMEGLRDG